MRNHVRFRWAPVLAALVLIAGCNRVRETPEGRVLAVVDAMCEAVEDRDIAGFMEHIDDDYSDGDGNTAESLRGQVYVAVQRAAEVTVRRRVSDIEITGDRASATVVAGADTGRDSGVYRFEVSFVLDGDDWKVRRASWSSTSPAALVVPGR